MGLICWIKSKYYNHKLENADKKLANGNISKAEDIYRSILGKQNEAVVHLANLYVSNSNSKDLKLQKLREIEELKEFVDTTNSSDYQKELNCHINNIYQLAQQLFNSKDYSGAVTLIESIRKYKGNNGEYQDKEHRFKAYLYLSKSLSSANYSVELGNCTHELDLIKNSKETDIINIQQILISQKRYVRAIIVLMPFKSLSSDFKNSIIDCIVQIVSNNDSELKNPKKISDFCKEVEISVLAAQEIAAKAVTFASKSRFEEAVVFDSFASEFLSNDNKFNNDRCRHLLEEASLRANDQEISQIISLAQTLKLSEAQVATLKKRILQLSSIADVFKGIKLCRLFKGEKSFDKQYVELATKTVKNGHVAILDSVELRKIISNISTERTVIDYLALFVDYIVSFKDEFYLIANKLYANGEQEKSYFVCSKIEKTKSWIALYLQLKEKDINKVTSISQKVGLYQDALIQIKQATNNPETITDTIYGTFWKTYSDILIKKSTSQPKEKAICDLVSIREELVNVAKSAPGYFEILASMSNQIAKLRWSLANELEEDSEYQKASKQYDELHKENVPAYTNRSLLRYLICLIKDNNLSVDAENKIKNALALKSFEALREDLAYRYSIYLLKATRPTEAEIILKKYLPDESNLLSICSNIFVKEAEDRLQEFNDKLELMSQGEMSAEEAVLFHKSYDSTVRLITSRLKDTALRFSTYKNKIESYILQRLFNEEHYSEAFDEIKLLYPNFIQNDNAFRNIAIASLGLLENGETDDTKIKQTISIWISAIFTDRLFVKCLDYTSWDDQFTFTLQDSFGELNEYDSEELPDNINYNDPIENQNIAIKDVQNSLLTKIESIIRDQYPSYESFLNNERTALEGLIKLNLDEDFIIATPYLACMSKIVFDSISHALDYDYDQNYDNNEDVLSLGVVYGLKGEAYADYKATKQMADNCCASLKNTLQSQRSAFANIARIKDFDKLYASVKAAVSTEMNNAIKNKLNYNSFLDQYETICKFLNETALSMSCANYVNAEVIHRLNDDTMQERDGVSYLVRIYNLAPNNIQIKQNLEAVMCSLARQCEETNNLMDVHALNSALRNTAGKFDTIVEDARIQGKLNAIVEKVNNNKMKNDAALKAVHELYVKCPNNERVCENLVTICSICIHQYIIGDGYSSSVTSILNKINNNKSATFKKHAKKMAKEYLDIWQQLPADSQMLMSGMGALTGKTLNSKGLALKSGLDYLQKLGDVPDTSLSSILSGRLGGCFDNDLPF